MAGSEKNPPNPLLLNDHCSVQGREDKVFAQGRQTRRAPKKDISASECRIQKSACFQTGELKNFVVSILRKSLIVNDRVFESAKLGLRTWSFSPGLMWVRSRTAFGITTWYFGETVTASISISFLFLSYKYQIDSEDAIGI